MPIFTDGYRSDLQDYDYCGDDYESEDSEDSCENGVHEYAEQICPKCGATFCYSCCGGTNRDQGGKHETDWTLCPICGYNVDEEE